MSEFVTPPPLSPGDRVAIVAPASGLAARFPHVYERGLDRLRDTFDLEPVEYPTATKDDDWLAAHPAERAADIEDAFRDPDIGAVIATIGGNDQIRILDHLDTDVLREHPTRFFGLSDNTNLAIQLWNAGVVSYYGGHVLTEFAQPGPLSEYQESALRRALFEEAVGELDPAPTFTDSDAGWESEAALEEPRETFDNPGPYWRGGGDPVAGRTWGGCFELVELNLAADRYLPDLDALEGSILLLETSEELPAPGMVRRGLIGMGERGLLERVDGVLVGRVKARSHRQDRDREARQAYRDDLREAFVDVISDYNTDAPVVLGLDFGHTSPAAPIPVGGQVSVDPQAERIVFE